MKKKIYNCPGHNPNHYAYRLRNERGECTLDYEHAVEGRRGDTFKCNLSRKDKLDPTFQDGMHSCENNIGFYDGYGPAVDYCRADDYGRLWIGNGEYGSMVRVCPFCGFKGEHVFPPFPNKEK